MLGKTAKCLKFIQTKSESDQNCKELDQILKDLGCGIYDVLDIKSSNEIQHLNFAGIAAARDKVKFLNVILNIAPTLLCQDTKITDHSTIFNESTEENNYNPTVKTEVNYDFGILIKVTPALIMAIRNRRPETILAILNHSAFSSNKNQDIEHHTKQVVGCFNAAKHWYQNTLTQDERQILSMLNSQVLDLFKEMDAQKEKEIAAKKQKEAEARKKEALKPTLINSMSDLEVYLSAQLPKPSNVVLSQTALFEIAIVFTFCQSLCTIMEKFEDIKISKPEHATGQNQHGRY